MLGEAYDPSADYQQTLQELQAVFRDHGEHAAQLEPGRRFLAVPLAPMVQHGANEADVELVLAIQEVAYGDHAEYTVWLDHLQDGDDGLRESYNSEESVYYTDPEAQELEVPESEDDEVYTHKDWRARIAAAVAIKVWDKYESWFWVFNGDPAPIVKAAVAAEKANMKKLKESNKRQKEGDDGTS